MNEKNISDKKIAAGTEKLCFVLNWLCQPVVFGLWKTKSKVRGN